MFFSNFGFVLLPWSLLVYTYIRVANSVTSFRVKMPVFELKLALNLCEVVLCSLCLAGIFLCQQKFWSFARMASHTAGFRIYLGHEPNVVIFYLPSLVRFQSMLPLWTRQFISFCKIVFFFLERWRCRNNFVTAESVLNLRWWWDGGETVSGRFARRSVSPIAVRPD